MELQRCGKAKARRKTLDLCARDEKPEPALLPESPEKKYKSETRAFPPGQERARRGVTPSFWNLAVLQRATNRPPTSGAPSGTPDEERRFRSASRVRFPL